MIRPRLAEGFDWIKLLCGLKIMSSSIAQFALGVAGLVASLHRGLARSLPRNDLELAFVQAGDVGGVCPSVVPFRCRCIVLRHPPLTPKDLGVSCCLKHSATYSATLSKLNIQTYIP